MDVLHCVGARLPPKPNEGPGAVLAVSRDNPMETFQWQHLSFDVTKINEDIASQRLTAWPITLYRPVVDWYATNVLGLSGATKLLPQMASVNMEHVRGLSEQRRQQPVVLVRFPVARPDDPLSIPLPGALCVNLSTGTAIVPYGVSGDVIAIDGNHRIAAAHIGTQSEVRALLLTLDQLEQQQRRYFRY